jgi:hypothetical protein
MKLTLIILTAFLIITSNSIAQMGGGHHGGSHINPDSLIIISKSGTVLIDSTMMYPRYFLDENSNGTPEYFLNFGPHWYQPDSSNADRPNNGEQITIEGGLWENNMMNEPMIIVYKINGEFWRNPFDTFWNNMGFHSHSNNGCGNRGFGWMHDSLTTITLSGIALVDTTFIHEIYYLDTNNDNQPDYFLNFGPWWYDPNSGAARPINGDNITITGGELNRESLPMIIVYEINGLLWRDSSSLGQHFGGGWMHRNMTQAQKFHSPFDNDDEITMNPGWYGMGGMHGGHGGMMTDSMFLSFFETIPENLPGSFDENTFCAYELDIYQNNGMNGTHHNGECGGHMHFNSNAIFQLHYTDDQVSGFNENSISVKYWDNETAGWVNYSGVSVNTSRNTISFSASDLSNFIILSAEQITGVESGTGNIKKFVLEQNYPNPFNPVTKIIYTIPNAESPLPEGAGGGLVTLKVYNILGREVATLVDEEKPAGRYELEFDGSQLSSGVYFYKLISGGLNITRKMLLLK